ncbi:hypothetical protein [Natrinema longum]|uniref:Uncharacterized protein n=1 Tax=Natrinema longum TaxID=370324 RepID=A0A8A2U6N7_9EURY|nr:hypothetical protein [Natrinema longum]MBZ6494434.1 hypothetical protein [Natrinema longum]QSW84243.1 hypothetical protein J0X27_12380 [Natrinema longum]
MGLRNRHGTHVDPVPFLVVVGLSFMLLLSFGPLYGRALGLPLETAIGASAGLFAVAAVLAFYRQVWTFRPETTGAVPSTARAERLFYLIPILTALILGLAVPLVLG